VTTSPRVTAGSWVRSSGTSCPTPESWPTATPARQQNWPTSTG
tara:strand:- start:143040 stop:143168 length:129 start_codon:yes stop_codon:yes gene_type:complete